VVKQPLVIALTWDVGLQGEQAVGFLFSPNAGKTADAGTAL